jgi:hypothetical protein
MQLESYETDGICRKQKDPLIEIVGTHLHYKNSTLFQIVTNFKQCFQNNTKQIKDIFAQSITEK